MLTLNRYLPTEIAVFVDNLEHGYFWWILSKPENACSKLVIKKLDTVIKCISVLTIKTLEWRNKTVLVSLLITWNKFRTLVWFTYGWLGTSIHLLGYRISSFISKDRNKRIANKVRCKLDYRCSRKCIFLKILPSCFFQFI